MAGQVYTIGHSDLKIEIFIDHLLLNGITAVADVRSSPYSRMQPQFNRELLKSALEKSNIAYVFLGKELGARSEQSECYKNGKVQFEILARQPLFIQGIDRVVKGLNKYTVALMCTEKDPLNCHRTILVSRHLFENNFEITHILYDGSTESHSQLEKRLLKALRMDADDLFLSWHDIITRGYSKWGDKIAYTLESSNDEEKE